MTDKILQDKKVAVLVETEYIPMEIEHYLKRFPLLGASVDLMTYLWGKKERVLVSDVTEPGEVSQNLCVTKDVGDYDANDYDIVIMVANYCAVRLREIPPMGSLGSPELTKTAPAVAFFAEAMKNKKIIKAAMCHALWILTPFPDLLKGRKVICHTVVLADIHNAGAIFVPDKKEYVVDDDLVTARSAANLNEYFDAIVEQAKNR
jgi:protease I